jgi:hypothetical protein
MHTNKFPNTERGYMTSLFSGMANTQNRYVPYFYEATRVQSYLTGANESAEKLISGPAGYDFTSDLSGRKTYFRQQSVEDVIRNGYLSVPKTEPETAIISDKKHAAWLGLDDIISQVRNRFEVYERNLYELEISKCAAINCLYEHRAYHGPTPSKVEYSVKKRLDGLYSEQREERVNLWRDISRLKLLLPENAQKYMAAYRKISILENDKGDGP